jgi:hypothetical protein
MVFSVPSARDCTLLNDRLLRLTDAFPVVQAQSLIEFWSENFRVQVEARVGSFDFDADGGFSSSCPLNVTYDPHFSSSGETSSQDKQV